MSAVDYISLKLKLGPKANKPEWDGAKTSRLILYMRKYKPNEALAAEFDDLDLDIEFSLATKRDDEPIKEEMCLLIESPLGKITKSVFFPDDKRIVLDSPDIDKATLKPGDIIAYAYPIYAMHPDIKFV